MNELERKVTRRQSSARERLGQNASDRPGDNDSQPAPIGGKSDLLSQRWHGGSHAVDGEDNVACSQQRRINQLERENKVLSEVNDILRKAVAHYAGDSRSLRRRK